MRKNFTLFALMLIMGIAASAQDVFKKGDIVANLQIGYGSYKSYSILVPPTTLSVDFAAIEDLIKGENGSIGFGGSLSYSGYRAFSSTETLHYKERANSWNMGFRATFHYQFVPNLDTYAGLTTGLTRTKEISKVKDFDGDVVLSSTYRTRSSFYTSFIAGARYYFNDFFGVSAEAGFATPFVTDIDMSPAVLRAGISFKF